jgi:parallel beta-helix repeat protein
MKTILLAFVLVFLSVSLFGARLVIVVCGSSIYHVYPDDSIQDAIDSAGLGDTIFVHSGTYHENVVVNKSVLLFGEGRKDTIIDGGGNSVVVNVTSDYVVLREFAIRNGDDGVDVYESSNVTIQNNLITDNLFGIRLYRSSHNTVFENNVTANQICGIFLQYSSSNTISWNNITADNYAGIWTELYSNSNIISGNNIKANNIYGIRLESSSNSTIMENNIADNFYYGISFGYSSNCSIVGNNITNNGYGASFNYFSNNNSVYGNNIANNRYGVHLYLSSNNTVYHNNFTNNTEQVVCYNTVNVWDDGYPSGGNYWSDYEDRYPGAEEIDGSRIWNMPYEIDEQNNDRYPIVPEFFTWTSMLLNLIVLTVAMVMYRQRLFKTPTN